MNFTDGSMLATNRKADWKLEVLRLFGGGWRFCLRHVMKHCRSRSDRWCATEPRGEGLGGGVRSQGGAKGEGGASNTLSAADAGHRRHIIALGLIALAQRP